MSKILVFSIECDKMEKKEDYEKNLSDVIKMNLRPPAGYKVATELYVNTEDKFELGSARLNVMWRCK